MRKRSRAVAQSRSEGMLNSATVDRATASLTTFAGIALLTPGAVGYLLVLKDFFGELRLLEDSQRIKDAVEQEFNRGTGGIRAKNPYEVFTHVLRRRPTSNNGRITIEPTPIVPDCFIPKKFHIFRLLRHARSLLPNLFLHAVKLNIDVLTGPVLGDNAIPVVARWPKSHCQTWDMIQVPRAKFFPELDCCANRIMERIGHFENPVPFRYVKGYAYLI